MIGSIIIAVVVGVVVSYVVISLILPKLLKETTDQVMVLAEQKLGAEKNEIKIDLKNEKEIVEKIAKTIREDLEKTKDKLEAAERERVGSFRELRQAVEDQVKVTSELSTTTESLRRVLSNNQMRGQFGEQVAENLLKMTGFVRGIDYDFNKEQKSGSRPDFTIYLPDKTKINCDAKFPYQSLQKMTETENQAARNELEKIFKNDIREKIKQVTGRDYINAEDSTVDFVIMFIPNEMIFSYIYEKMNDVWLEAMKQKVVMAGPFSFTAILRMVRQAYDNFKYQKNVQKIIGHIKTFEVEFQKYNEEFLKIGERIESLTRQYQTVNSTRTNQLTKSIDRIRLEENSSSKPLLEENR
jgi:DNA recombination protein RmuC